MGYLLDFGKCGGEAVPLCLVLFAPLGFCEGVGEGGVVFPEGEFLEGGFAFE